MFAVAEKGYVVVGVLVDESRAVETIASTMRSLQRPPRTR